MKQSIELSKNVLSWWKIAVALLQSRKKEEFVFLMNQLYDMQEEESLEYYNGKGAVFSEGVMEK